MRVALGVGGGIAAYKAIELSRNLQERGCEVQVILTSAAQQFVQPLTFATLTGRKVITGLWAESDSAHDTLSSSVEHIQVAQDNDLLVVAPATADLLAKFANGLADDFLSTLYLAFAGKVMLAPAMNSNMWMHSATQHNVQRLRDRGHYIVEPAEGLLACGTVGPGRLAEPQAIAEAAFFAVKLRDDLSGETVLITAGPTQEPLDPVRYITNRSSGKMGYALAAVAAARGANVILISGPVSLATPPNVEIIHVKTALQMRAAVIRELHRATIVIKAAAVADYHLSEVPTQKRKKTAARLTLDLDPTPDILAEIGQKKSDQLLIGFAAETTNLIEEGRRKLLSKNCDMIVANLVNSDAAGFESEDNEVVLIPRRGDPVPLPLAPKREIAEQIFDQALRLRLALHAAAS